MAPDANLVIDLPSAPGTPLFIIAMVLLGLGFLALVISRFLPLGEDFAVGMGGLLLLLAAMAVGTVNSVNTTTDRNETLASALSDQLGATVVGDTNKALRGVFDEVTPVTLTIDGQPQDCIITPLNEDDSFQARVACGATPLTPVA